MTRDNVHNWRWWYNGTCNMVKRQTIVPFESAIAVLSIWAGFSGFFEVSISSQAFNALLSHLSAMMFHLVYVVSGMAIFFGIGWNYRNLEAFGLVLLLMSLLVRAIAAISLLGYTHPVAISPIIQVLTFGPACVIRFYSLWIGDVIIAAKSEAVTTHEEIVENVK